MSKKINKTDDKPLESFEDDTGNLDYKKYKDNPFFRARIAKEKIAPTFNGVSKE